jgi:hypothetical protein
VGQRGVLSGVGRDDGDDLINVQCTSTLNSHNESPLHKKYILIKMGKKRNLENIKVGYVSTRLLKYQDI